MADFTIGQGDLLPVIQVVLKDSSVPPQVVDLTGATVQFLMGVGQKPHKVAAAATIIGPPGNGTVQYLWAGTDTDTAQTYDGQFVVTFPSGKQESFPNSRHLEIIVEQRVKT